MLDIVDPSIVGEWHLINTEYNGESLNKHVDVYFVINSDCTFELYQKGSSQSRYTKHTGTCKTEDGVLMGTYSTGKAWGDSYAVSVEGDMLTLLNSDGTELQEYKKESLAQAEKDAADISTRSESDIIEPIL